MPSAAPPLEQFYKLTRDRLEVAVDDEQLTAVDALEAWTQVCLDLHAMDPERNPKRLVASAYRLAQQTMLSADGLSSEDVAALARLTTTARRLQELITRIGG